MLPTNDSGAIKRLFFALEVEAAWMHPLPEGRVLKEEHRHVTLAFLGNQSLPELLNRLKDFPVRQNILGFAGKCDRLLFLPERKPRVAAGHIKWVDDKILLKLHDELNSWLAQHGYEVDNRELLSHATIARAPFQIKQWKKAFYPFPLIAKSLNLYESTGSLNYVSVWKIPFILPIKEIEHTADVAFQIRGRDMQELFLHAQLALAFKFPEMLRYFSEGEAVDTLDDVIIQLNGCVSLADAEAGCPFKAISFHGKIVSETNGYLFWEMIVDV